jgi:hypothetical protein
LRKFFCSARRRREEAAEGMVRVGAVCQQREGAFLFRCLLNLRYSMEGRLRRFPPNNEQVERGMAVPRQVRVVWPIPRQPA